MCVCGPWMTYSPSSPCLDAFASLIGNTHSTKSMGVCVCVRCCLGRPAQCNFVLDEHIILAHATGPRLLFSLHVHPSLLLRIGQLFPIPQTIHPFLQQITLGPLERVLFNFLLLLIFVLVPFLLIGGFVAAAASITIVSVLSVPHTGAVAPRDNVDAYFEHCGGLSPASFGRRPWYPLQHWHPPSHCCYPH